MSTIKSEVREAFTNGTEALIAQHEDGFTAKQMHGYMAQQGITDDDLPSVAKLAGGKWLGNEIFFSVEQRSEGNLYAPINRTSKEPPAKLEPTDEQDRMAGKTSSLLYRLNDFAPRHVPKRFQQFDTAPTKSYFLAESRLSTLQADHDELSALCLEHCPIVSNELVGKIMPIVINESKPVPAGLTHIQGKFLTETWKLTAQGDRTVEQVKSGAIKNRSLEFIDSLASAIAAQAREKLLRGEIVTLKKRPTAAAVDDAKTDALTNTVSTLKSAWAKHTGGDAANAPGTVDDLAEALAAHGKPTEEEEISSLALTRELSHITGVEASEFNPGESPNDFTHAVLNLRPGMPILRMREAAAVRDEASDMDALEGYRAHVRKLTAAQRQLAKELLRLDEVPDEEFGITELLEGLRRLPPFTSEQRELIKVLRDLEEVPGDDLTINGLLTQLANDREAATTNAVGAKPAWQQWISKRRKWLVGVTVIMLITAAAIGGISYWGGGTTTQEGVDSGISPEAQAIMDKYKKKTKTDKTN